jgi:large subunit ribosomal protein L17
MRHRNSGRKFDRNTSHRRAMLRNLTANLVLHERIETTDAKAKEVRRVAERLITKARRLGEAAYTEQEKLSAGDKAKRLATERNIASFIPRFVTRIEKGGEEKRVDIVEKVLLDLAKRFKDRPGGYTRIIKFGMRRGDGAPMAMLELVGEPEGTEDKPKKKAKKAKAGAETAKAE